MDKKDKKARILDIAMNLNRVGNWAADDYRAKKKRIQMFLGQTSEDILSLDLSLFPQSFRKTLERFLEEYKSLEKMGQQGPKDELDWAERMMTWGNILTHRASLIKSL